MLQRPAIPTTEAARLFAPDRKRAGGFSLVELLVVMAIVAILAALLLPALGAMKAKAKTTACIHQLKQFGVATQIYSGDNAGLLPPNSPTSGTNGWVGGSMKLEAEATSANLIRQAKLYPYLGQLNLFRCPADYSTTPTAGGRLRSYSMNSWIGSRAMETTGTAENFRTFVKQAEFAVTDAAQLWLIADEHEATIDDGYFVVTMNDTSPFASFPALRHDRRFNLSFVDGHAETWRLRDPGTQLGNQGPVARNNMDWLRLKQATTVLQ